MIDFCKCGHSHIDFVGDLGKDEDEIGYSRTIECSQCDCEEYVKHPSKMDSKEVNKNEQN